MSDVFLTVEGKQYKQIYRHRPNRAIIDFDGVYVLVDLLGENWELSGVPGDVIERQIISDLSLPMRGSVITVKND
jgi:hypothetical protein